MTKENSTNNSAEPPRNPESILDPSYNNFGDIEKISHELTCSMIEPTLFPMFAMAESKIPNFLQHEPSKKYQKLAENDLKLGQDAQTTIQTYYTTKGCVEIKEKLYVPVSSAQHSSKPVTITNSQKHFINRVGNRLSRAADSKIISETNQSASRIVTQFTSNGTSPSQKFTIANEIPDFKNDSLNSEGQSSVLSYQNGQFHNESNAGCSSSQVENSNATLRHVYELEQNVSNKKDNNFHKESECVSRENGSGTPTSSKSTYKSVRFPALDNTYIIFKNGEALCAYDSPLKHFTCSICKKSFTQSGTLKRHMRIHTGYKPFKCDSCAKTFSLKSYLITHQRTHTGEKPYQCTTCGKWFSQPSSLKTHTQTHSDVKPYECSSCGMKFSLKSYLTVHERTHTGEKPYKCGACGKTFTQGSSLNVHLKKHVSRSVGMNESL